MQCTSPASLSSFFTRDDLFWTLDFTWKLRNSRGHVLLILQSLPGFLDHVHSLNRFSNKTTWQQCKWFGQNWKSTYLTNRTAANTPNVNNRKQRTPTRFLHRLFLEEKAEIGKKKIQDNIFFINLSPHATYWENLSKIKKTTKNSTWALHA